MTGPLSDTVLLTFLLFCRIGACLMLMPGFSSPRVPVQIRLFVAIAVTLALTPILLPVLKSSVFRPSLSAAFVLIIGETLTGGFIALLVRIYFMALQFMAAALANFVGFYGFSEMGVEESEPNAPLAGLITLAAAVLFFIGDLHWEVLKGIVQSYAALPLQGPLVVEFGLARLAEATADAFLLALQIASPFLVYALAVNLAFGLLNKLTPQIPVYFVSLPFVIAGGLLLLYFVAGEFLSFFMVAVESRLIRG